MAEHEDAEDAEESAIYARREKQLEEITAAIESLSKLSSQLKLQQQTLDMLQSVSDGLYEEIDKLAKKSPVDQISNLVLGHVNDVIRESKALVPDDPFMKRYPEFVAAGDNPEHRDVVVMLRQIRQGLDRYETRLTSRREKTDKLLSDAEGIKVAVEIFLEGSEEVAISVLLANKVNVSAHWKDGTFSHNFDFWALNRTEIPVYFRDPE